MRQTKLSTRGLLLIGILFLSGCGDARRQSIEGTVSFDGRPVNQGYIRLIPQSGTPGPTAGAKVENGHFSIIAEDGPFAGEFRVEITAMRPGKRKAYDPETNQKIAVPEQYIPAKYNSQSELTATIEKDQSRPLEFSLQTK